MCVPGSNQNIDRAACQCRHVTNRHATQMRNVFLMAQEYELSCDFRYDFLLRMRPDIRFRHPVRRARHRASFCIAICIRAVFYCLPCRAQLPPVSKWARGAVTSDAHCAHFGFCDQFALVPRQHASYFSVHQLPTTLPATLMTARAWRMSTNHRHRGYAAMLFVA